LNHSWLKSKLLSAKPEFYKDSEESTNTMRNTIKLKTDIQLLTEEWEKLTLEANG